jgi:hypothetical protein
MADRLTLAIEIGPMALTARVPYWHHKSTLYVDSAYPLERGLAEYIDRETHATCSGFFDLIWQQAKERARVKTWEGGLSNPASSRNPGGNEDHVDRESAGTEAFQAGEGTGRGTGASGYEGDARTGTERESKERDGPRKRLCSYVTFAGEGVGAKDGSSSSDNNDANEVEQAGRAHMLAYFKSHGADVISRENDSVGYDFEVSVAGRTLYIELKASRDRWQGWEHGLTRNEFVQAFAKGEYYFLCVVDRALTDDWKIYFIANPSGLIDQFLFDDPWKRVAVDMNARLEQMKRDDDEADM